MARLHETKQCYSSLSKSSLQHPILFVIDMINGFVRRGALHDPAIAQAAQPIKDLIELLECRTVFVADSHPPKTREFLSYPAHCVIGSGEDEVIDELKPYIHQLIRKNSTNTFFST